NAIADELDRVAAAAMTSGASATASTPDEPLIAAANAEMARALDRVTALLDGRDFLFGDALSAADCIAYPVLKFAARRDPADDELFHVVLDDYQRLEPRHAPLAAWIERVAALPQA